jgi:hypothetical protein
MSLGVLTRGSICHSLMDDEAKVTCEALWDTQWEAFLHELVGQAPASAFNGKAVNGKAVNGKAVNGKSPNGATVNGGASNGKTANGV